MLLLLTFKNFMLQFLNNLTKEVNMFLNYLQKENFDAFIGKTFNIEKMDPIERKFDEDQKHTTYYLINRTDKEIILNINGGLFLFTDFGVYAFNEGTKRYALSDYLTENWFQFMCVLMPGYEDHFMDEYKNNPSMKNKFLLSVANLKHIARISNQSI